MSPAAACSLPGKLRSKILAVSSHSNVLIILLILLTSHVVKVKHSYDRPLDLFRHQRNVNEVVFGGRRPVKTARRCALLQVAKPGHATPTGPWDQSAVAQGAHPASPWGHSKRLPKLQSELPWSHKVLLRCGPGCSCSKLAPEDEAWWRFQWRRRRSAFTGPLPPHPC